MRRVLPAALDALAVLASAAPADAALRWGSCSSARAFRCAILRVPLDHSGRVKGTIPLHVARMRGGSRRHVLVALSGGPGQGAVAEADSSAEGLRSAASRYAIVTLDQRGTGDS